MFCHQFIMIVSVAGVKPSASTIDLEKAETKTE